SRAYTSVAAGPKQKKAKAKPAPAPVDAPAAPKTAGEAVAQAPDDVDTLSIYADSIAATDPALSEYIQLGIRAHRADGDREPFEQRAAAMFREHGAKWLRAWNTPITLFDPKHWQQYERFCGLPRVLKLEGIPPNLAAIDAQVANLPIAIISVSDVSTK